MPRVYYETISRKWSIDQEARRSGEVRGHGEGRGRGRQNRVWAGGCVPLASCVPLWVQGQGLFPLIQLKTRVRPQVNIVMPCYAIETYNRTRES